MKVKLIKALDATCLAMFLFVIFSCGDEDVVQEPAKSETTGKGLIRLTENIGEWDEAVIYAQDGYVLYKDEIIDDSIKKAYVQIQSPNSKYDCAIYADANSSLPEMLIFDDEIYNFYNEGDSIIYVSLSNKDGVESLDTIHFTFSNATRGWHATTITYLNRDDKVKKVIKALDSILNAGSNYTSSQINQLKKALDDISIFYYYENVEQILDSLDLCRDTYGDTGDSIIYCFSQYATKVKIKKYDPIKYSLSIVTLRAKNIKTHSAKIKGQLNCLSENFRKYGKWGVVYSRDHYNLSLEKKEGIVYADTTSEKNFVLKISSLLSNTTYYYKVFYKFNSEEHGDIRFNYGDPEAESYVDPWYMSFTTARQFTCPDNHHPHAINLGLPSGTKWACCNIGATIPGEFGSYFRWAEVEERWEGSSPYSFADSEISGEIDGTALDAATVKWGTPWRIPTLEQFRELLQYCSAFGTSERGETIHRNDSIDDYYINNGKNFTGPNGNIIFMPSSGYIGRSTTFRRNSNGYYWSSTPDATDNLYQYSYSLILENGKPRIMPKPWELGLSIRPVIIP